MKLVMKKFGGFSGEALRQIGQEMPEFPIVDL
jgi:hypothetical protein